MTLPTFRPHVFATDLPAGLYAQTALADLDGDGQLEYIVGRQYGDIYWYDYQPDGSWVRHHLGCDSPSDVGGCALDVDGDGRPDFVTGGAWYRNPGSGDQMFERIVFDSSLSGVHDVLVGDVDGDGRPDVVTMSDKNTLRWYQIPQDPKRPWVQHDVAPGLHSGATLGDVDGDGVIDIVRTYSWYENVDGNGLRWIEHFIGANTPPPDDFRRSFAYNATYSYVCDVNGDGKMDIIFVDSEIPGGAVWWMENVDGAGRSWQRHEICARGKEPRRGAYHSLYVGDLDGDGDYDVFSCEMEAVRGDEAPRYYIWENVDGRGGVWREHVVLNMNLGGHNAVVGDVRAVGKLDIIAKPWRPSPKNALGGKMFIVHLQNADR